MSSGHPSKANSPFPDTRNENFKAFRRAHVRTILSRMALIPPSLISLNRHQLEKLAGDWEPGPAIPLLGSVAALFTSTVLKILTRRYSTR